MRHPNEGVLRHLVDDPVAVPAADRDHVSACAACTSSLDAIRADAEFTARSLAVDVELADVDRSWRLLSTSIGDDGSGAPAPRTARLRTFLRRPAVAGAAVALVLAGAGTAAANDWLPIFRTEEVAPVNIAPSDLNALPDLSGYGEVTVVSEPRVHVVADAETAAEEIGLDVPEVGDLPRGVSGRPTYRVGGQAVLEFTFSAERAARTAAAAGERMPPPPPGLDGSSIRLVAGPGVALTWSKQGGIPVLVVGRAAAPTALSSSGVPFETMRDYLLSLPGLPENVAGPLRSFNAEGSTLPLPVPGEYVDASTAEIDGERATVLVTRDGSTSAVVWVTEGVLTVVGGTVEADEVVSLARGLR